MTKEEAIKRIRDFGLYHAISDLPHSTRTVEAFEMAIKALEQPERKKGKWLIDRGLYKCSCCNQLWAEWWAVSKPIERMNKEAPYCPMCGSYNGEVLLPAQPEQCEDAVDYILKEVKKDA